VVEEKIENISFARSGHDLFQKTLSEFDDHQTSLREEKSSNRHKVVSYFAGCGGMDLGFHGGFEALGSTVPKLDFDIEKAYDYDERCVETYKRNISDRIEQVDLSNFDPKMLPALTSLLGAFRVRISHHAGLSAD
jgi:DNA (cytosine-5)-methyltransferase 1